MRESVAVVYTKCVLSFPAMCLCICAAIPVYLWQMGRLVHVCTCVWKVDVYSRHLSHVSPF